ncbi:MAG: DUF4842 domain-containing protein [Prevotella sp.]|nr:DUF4842 domain-containing protein [Prevotella sp.]
MRKLISNTALVAIAAGGMLFASCGDHDMFNPNYKAEEYAANWENKIGAVDPNQDWSMATSITAKANVPNITGNSILKIYNYSPLAPECRVLGVTNLNNGVGEVTFDAIKGFNSLFVTIEQDGEYKLYGGYNVENGQLSIGNVAKAKTRAAGTCPVGKGDLVDFMDKQVLIKPAVTHEETTTTVTFKGYSYDNVMCYNIDEVAAEWKRKGNPNWQPDFPLPEWDGSNATYTEQIVEYNGKKYVFPEYCFNVTTTTETIVDEEAVYNNIDINLQYLTGVETKAAEPWKFGWGYQMFGPGSFFQEKEKYYESPKYGNGNLYDLETLKQIEKGFSIKTTGGEISLPFIYGATDYANQFGYVFYKDGEDPLTQPHYILIEHGRPQDNIYWNSWKGTAVGKMELSVWSNFEYLVDHKDDNIQCYCYNNIYGGESTGIYGPTGKHLESCYIPEEKYIEAYNKPVYGTEYKLVYFNESGNATYEIPAGLNVAFFICRVNTPESRDYVKGDFNYSLPELNKRIDHLYGNGNSPTFEEGNNTVGHAKARGAVKAASWTFKGHKFLGFEDGGNDEDLNDIVFWVEGNYEDDDEEIVIPDPDPDPVPSISIVTETQSWILACEDLGDTDDLDFNDIVLEVTKVDEYEVTKENNVEVAKAYKGSKLVAKCLAAGGTLPANIYYNDKLIGEAHAMLGETNTGKMINTETITNTPIEQTIAESIDQNWTLSNNKNSFRIVVQNDGDQTGAIIEAPRTTGKAPQMLIVPGNWKWPKERKQIYDAYPEFEKWNGNATFTDWCNTYKEDLLIAR